MISLYIFCTIIVLIIVALLVSLTVNAIEYFNAGTNYYDLASEKLREELFNAKK